MNAQGVAEGRGGDGGSGGGGWWQWRRKAPPFCVVEKALQACYCSCCVQRGAEVREGEVETVGHAVLAAFRG